MIKNIDDIVAQAKKQAAEATTMPPEQWRKPTKKPQPKRNTFNIGRNDQCPCISGKKFKKCCMMD